MRNDNMKACQSKCLVRIILHHVVCTEGPVIVGLSLTMNI